LARLLKGWVYVIETPSHHGPDHKIVISKINKTIRGAVIDVTLDNPFAGEVSNVFNFKQTALEIGKIYNISGWRKLYDYSKK
jgi:hypothetical protein